MPAHAKSRRLTSDEWMRLRIDMSAQTLVLGCPSSDVDFILSTALFATWIAETLDRTVSSSEQSATSASGWLLRSIRALIWSLRRQRAAGFANSDAYEDSEVWNHVLNVQDAIPIFFDLSKREAEWIQQLAMGRARPSASELEKARQAFLRKVVPALNALYRSEN